MVKNVKKASAAVIGSLHQFTEDEVVTVRQKLLTWYDANHRVLPWRTIAATEPDRSKRAYAVWVSEIMLQQTQVSTVVSYFVKWMAKWPTVEDLARATLEEVNQVWAGLGYYSRARRLHEGAVKHLPGIGRYSGSAIASIALGCGVGVVDGNVNRVFARVRGIGADITLQSTTEHMWTLANQLVDSDRPGDFNQAMMEFGATVCTPKNPSCNSCPLSVHCVSHHRSGDQQERASITNHFKKRKMPSESSAVPDIECLPECALCLRKEDWDSSLGVQNYPRKAQKTQSRQKASAVVVLQGLLANLWEFPSIALTDGDSHQEKEVTEQLINQVYKILLDDQKGLTWPSRYQGGQWMTRKEFVTSATSTAMKKVLKAVEVSEEKNKNEKKMGLVEKSPDTKKQKTISQFFTAAPKKK
ncbi:adenine DNA glycosylase-like [Homarus americanus]|uniref:Adenine DNA glycosylase n=1 Tax=Homarus americanus TaxID=6706 RepID=A0A8J5JKW1_HOMAM|nr:adenine DNA glycosylase-like [Homarus americanus]